MFHYTCKGRAVLSLGQWSMLAEPHEFSVGLSCHSHLSGRYWALPGGCFPRPWAVSSHACTAVLLYRILESLLLHISGVPFLPGPSPLFTCPVPENSSATSLRHLGLSSNLENWTGLLLSFHYCVLGKNSWHSRLGELQGSTYWFPISKGLSVFVVRCLLSWKLLLLLFLFGVFHHFVL